MAKSPELEHPNKAFGWAARDTSGLLSPFNFSRRSSLSLIQSCFIFFRFNLKF
ncbi:8-hydroxygeraniol dehydrogenase [Quercus suber]|uniref:8-hydroxygeraniol dehydrogenase n=1 Tax=Quercus suber TaxID=58331 RepID=A0AAW0L4F1_QUESU